MSSKKRKWSFVMDGAKVLADGGSHTSKRVGGVFNTYIVAGGDGVIFHRSPYAKHGWYVEKNNTDFTGQKVKYNVVKDDDLNALDAFVGEERFKGWGNYVE